MKKLFYSSSVVEDENESQHGQHAAIMYEINNLEELSDWTHEWETLKIITSTPVLAFSDRNK